LQREALKLLLPFLDHRENPQRKLFRLLGLRVEKLEGGKKQRPWLRRFCRRNAALQAAGLRA